MENDKHRRQFLLSGLAISAGVASGAFSQASLAASPAKQAKDLFTTPNDKQLTDKELTILLSDNTMAGVTHKGSQYMTYLQKGGTAIKEIDDGRKEKGQWKIENNELTLRFPTIASGESFSMMIYRFKQGDLYKGWAPKTHRWTWFIVEQGKASEIS